MKFIKFFFIIFITFPSSIKADLNQELSLELKKGGKLIFIRHAYAPGGGDPENFDINNCDTQRNLSEEGRNQAKKIGDFFKDNDVQIFKVFSSEWCRCKETAKLAFTNFETKDFLNSFFSAKFANNKNKQMLDLKNYVKKFKGNENLIFVTHYVVISEALDYAPSSGEIVIADKNFNKIGYSTNTFFIHKNLSSLKGYYYVTALDRSGNESLPTDTLIRNNCPQYVLPNVFTPNDDGKNDYFSPFFSDGSITDFDYSNCPRFVRKVNISIVDRTGVEVFDYDSSEDNINGIFINWDGKNKYGADVAEGIYYYNAKVVFDVLDGFDNEKEIKGWVQLLR